jgi:hypothetical protein
MSAGPIASNWSNRLKGGRVWSHTCRSCSYVSIQSFLEDIFLVYEKKNLNKNPQIKEPKIETSESM